jgi:hypothetical protein
VFRTTQRLSCAWKVPFSTAALRIDNKPQREIIDGKKVEHIGTIALSIGNKGCVDIAHANGVTKLSKHLDIKHKYHQHQIKAGCDRYIGAVTTRRKVCMHFSKRVAIPARVRASRISLQSSIFCMILSGAHRGHRPSLPPLCAAIFRVSSLILQGSVSSGCILSWPRVYGRSSYSFPLM